MNIKGPVLKACRTLADVITAIDNLRTYFAAPAGVGNVSVTQPANSATLTITDGKALIVDETWELQGIEVGQTGLTMSTVKFVKAKIGGVYVKIALIE